MKFAVIGATGYVGNAVVQELAARGHDVTAFARNTGKVFAAPNVRAVAADVTAAGFAEQLAGFDAVVSAPSIPAGPIRTLAAISATATPPSSPLPKARAYRTCSSSAARAASTSPPACKSSTPRISPKKFTTVPTPHATF